jgi:predicted O-methyltransferase YrrM
MSDALEKLALASKLAVRHPRELVDRLLSLVETRRERAEVLDDGLDWTEFSKRLTEAVGGDVATSLQELRLASLEQEVSERIVAMNRAPFATLHSADLNLARTCYALCRAMKPACVVETGVAYGMTSSFILAALEANGMGVLHSIDLAPLTKDADAYVGALIPVRLRQRWRLHRGSTHRILPRLLPEVDPIDIFLHDSLHTYQTVTRELRQVKPHMAARAAVLVDDIESNRAYSEWVTAAAPVFSAVVHQSKKRSLFGVAIF